MYPGATSSNGPNYIDFLTTTYNQSYIQTYNFGYGGAVVNDSVVKNGFGITVQSFVDQVQDEFLPAYSNNSEVRWNSSNSLFTIFFGINDVTNSWFFGNDSLGYQVIESYQTLVDEVSDHVKPNRKLLSLRNFPAVCSRRTQFSLLKRPPHRSLAGHT